MRDGSGVSRVFPLWHCFSFCLLKMCPWKNVSIALLVFVAIISGVSTLQNLDTNSNNIGIDALNVNYK